MRRIFIRTCLVALLFVTTATQSQTPSQPPPKVPETVDQAVLILKTKWLSQKDLDWILRNPKDNVVRRLYRPFGTGVRNQFGLWGNNQALRDSCGNNNPESCSIVIFNRHWESVRADADPSLVSQLDSQFQLAQTITINEKGFHRMTTRELIKSIQSQIDEQLRAAAATGNPLSQSSLILEIAGDPDLNCFVGSTLGKNDSKASKEVPLGAALEGLGLINFFAPSHAPPKIVLHFSRKCQFRTPPYLYGISGM
jgi:hypothetical protein